MTVAHEAISECYNCEWNDYQLSPSALVSI